jgi:flagellar hook-associated protein 1 FlgK
VIRPLDLGFEGIQLAITGTATVGDQFQLRPTAGKAGSIAVSGLLQNSPSLIAASSAVSGSVTATAVGSPGATATATVSDLSKTKAGTYDFFFNGTAWTARRDGKVLVPVTPATGSTGTFSFEGITVTVGGTPASTDRFNLGLVVTGTANTTNGGNAKALADIQGDTKAIEGKSTLTEGYSLLATTAGVQAASAITGANAQAALVLQLKGQRQAISGVNLDEEAANLLRFQQAYQSLVQAHLGRRETA